MVFPIPSVAQSQALAPPALAIASVIDAIKTHNLRYVRLLYIPVQIMTVVAVTPETLSRDFRYKIEIPCALPPAEIARMQDALLRTSVKPSNSYGDLRWALQVELKKNGQTIQIYFDRSARNGQIDHNNVAIEGGLGAWLKNFTLNMH